MPSTCAYAKQHIDVFALISGDSDFSPLVGKLKENEKRVIGCGVRNSTSDLLVASCDEFLYYDDLVKARSTTRATQRRGKKDSDKPDEAVDQVLEIVRSLERDYDPLWGSMIKQTLRRVNPGFNESRYGHRSFSDVLHAMEDKGLIVLEYDEDRGNYKVRTRSR